MDAALELLQVAAAFQNRTQPQAEPLSWAQSFLRPAANAKQAQDFSRVQRLAEAAQGESLQHASSSQGAGSSVAVSGSSYDSADRNTIEAVSVRALSLDEAAQRVPGLPSGQLRAALGPQLAASAALLIDGAHVLHPTRYIRCTACPSPAVSNSIPEVVALCWRLFSFAQLEG